MQTAIAADAFFHISSRYQSSSVRGESEAHSWTPDLVKVWGSSLGWLLRHVLVLLHLHYKIICLHKLIYVKLITSESNRKDPVIKTKLHNLLIRLFSLDRSI